MQGIHKDIDLNQVDIASQAAIKKSLQDVRSPPLQGEKSCLVLGQQGHQDVTVVYFLPNKINIVLIYFELEFHQQ